MCIELVEDLGRASDPKSFSNFDLVLELVSIVRFDFVQRTRTIELFFREVE